jgi:hypothetical protein
MEVVMSDSYAGVRVPDPDRARLIRSVFEPSPIDVVAEAVSVAWNSAPAIYVERLEHNYRWSLAHKGGPYPLMRVAARFLQMDHHFLLIGFRTVEDGYAVLAEDPEHQPAAGASAILSPSEATTRAEALQMIQEAVG